MKKLKGFTLIEAIMVIILIGLLSVGVFITWPATTINLGAQADQVAHHIRYAQSLAMTKGRRYRFVRASTTTYQILDSTGAAVAFPNGATTITLNSGITFGTLTNLPNNLVNFDVNGVPYTDTGSPGTALAATATIPLTASGETKTVSILPVTGNVTVS